MTETNINALPVGYELDGYRILRLLGAGGFGITYLAEEIAIGRKVAIKEYLPSGFASRDRDSISVRPVSATAQQQFTWGLERFRKEASTLVAFEHPNIVAVYRYFEANGTAYLVMQYVEGKPLDAILGGAKTLAESEIEEVILPILDGLDQVHAARILHRDIKPANIYIRMDGRPVLLDFGAARQAFGSETRSITAIISEGYAPFEQYEAKGDQGAWTDIYAVGAVLYRCITGQRPAAAPERVSARLRNAPDPLTPVRVAAAPPAGARYSEAVLDATERALGITREERPQSIAELRALLRGAPTTRPAPSALQGTVGPTRTTIAPTMVTKGEGVAPKRSRLPMLAGIAVVLAAGAAGAYYALGPGARPTTTATAPATPPGTTVTGSPATPPATSAPPQATPPTVSPPATTPPPVTVEAEARRKAEELRRAQETRADAFVAVARQRLDQARAAARDGKLTDARRLGVETAGLIGNALDAYPASKTAPALRAELVLFQDDLARRITERQAALTREAQDAIRRERFEEAERRLEELAEIEPTAAALPGLRRDLDIAQRRAEDAERARRAEEERKRGEAEALGKLAGQRLAQAKAALQRGDHAEARRLAEDAAGLVKEAAAAYAASPLAAGLRREVDDFQRDLARQIETHVAALVREAREAIRAGKFDEAQQRLAAAAALEPAAPAVAAARRELDEARRAAQATPEAKPDPKPDPKPEARPDAKPEAKPEAKPDPDAEERERTRRTVGTSAFDPRARRAALYFDFDKAELSPAALQALGRAVDAGKDDAEAQFVAFCAYDLLEESDATAGRKLAQERCQAVARAAAQRGVAAARLRVGLGPAGKGPEFRRAVLSILPAKREEAKPDAPARPGGLQFAGRTGALSRLSAEKRAVMRIQMHFGAGGAMTVTCVTEQSGGAQAACFAQQSGPGTWTFNGTTLCIASAVINQPSNVCYQVSGTPPQIVLSGPGLLAGAMALR